MCKNGVSLRRHILPPSAANSIGPHKYASMRISKDRTLKEWSGRWDSNPRLDLGKVPYYPYTTTAPKQENFITSSPPRQDRIVPAKTHLTHCVRRPSYDAPSWIARNSALFDLADLKHARCLYDRRFPLPFSELGGFGTVCINTSKFLSVFVENRNLPVLVLASSVFAQLGAFSLFQ